MSDLTLDIGGRALPIRFTVRKRAHRLRLRINDLEERLDITLPRGVREAEGLEFAEENISWISQQFKSLPTRISFVDGATIPVCNQDHVICHLPGRRGRTVSEFGELKVYGDQAHLARRVRDWFHAESRRIIRPKLDEAAAMIEKHAGKLSIREMRTRWASCSDRGDFSFAWRLIMAPEDVIDYVIAHEVAHLIHMDHGREFWALVKEIDPQASDGKRWLKKYGSDLHRFG